MSQTKRIVDAIGRQRRIKYKYRYQSLSVRQRTFVRGDAAQLHSVRVLVSRWNIRTGQYLSANLTKPGTLKITRFR